MERLNFLFEKLQTFIATYYYGDQFETDLTSFRPLSAYELWKKHHRHKFTESIPNQNPSDEVNGQPLNYGATQYHRDIYESSEATKYRMIHRVAEIRDTYGDVGFLWKQSRVANKACIPTTDETSPLLPDQDCKGKSRLTETSSEITLDDSTMIDSEIEVENQAENLDKNDTKSILAQLADVTEIAVDSMGKIIDRGDRLDNMMVNAENLTAGGSLFKKTSRKVHFETRKKEFHANSLIAVVSAIIMCFVILIVVIVVGTILRFLIRLFTPFKPPVSYPPYPPPYPPSYPPAVPPSMPTPTPTPTQNPTPTPSVKQISIYRRSSKDSFQLPPGFGKDVGIEISDFYQHGKKP